MKIKKINIGPIVAQNHCDLAAIQMQYVVTSVRKVLYCVGIVCDGVRKVLDGVRKVSDGDRSVLHGVRWVSHCVKKLSY